MPTNPIVGHSMEVCLLDALPAGDNNIGNVDLASAIPAGTNNIGDVDVLTIAAGETHIGEVGRGGAVVQVTPVCDTSQLSANDVLFPTTAVANAVRNSGGKSELVSVVVLDEDDNAAANMRLWFLAANTTFGSANSAPSIDDAGSRDLLGSVDVASALFLDLGGMKVATVKNVGLVVAPTTGTTIYVAATSEGTPTQTASGIKVRLGFKYIT